MSFIDRDLKFLLSDFDATTIRVAGVVTTGHMEEVDAVTDDGNGFPVQERRTVIRLVRKEFEDADGDLVVGRGDTATLNGVDYVVTEILVGDPNALVVTGRDGRELVLRVRKV